MAAPMSRIVSPTSASSRAAALASRAASCRTRSLFAEFSSSSDVLAHRFGQVHFDGEPDLLGVEWSVVHDSDQIPGHDLDLAERASLGAVPDRRDMDEPESLASFDVDFVGAHFHQAFPRFSAHSWMIVAIWLSISLRLGIGTIWPPRV